MKILLFSNSNCHISNNTLSRVMVLVLACSLMLIDNPVKFHQNTLNGSQVTERTRLATDKQRQTGRQTTRAKTMSPSPVGGDIISNNHWLIVFHYLLLVCVFICHVTGA